jgi:hypothetical protein
MISLLPSAEEAAHKKVFKSPGTVRETQLAPPFVDVKANPVLPPKPDTANNLFPSPDDATFCQYTLGTSLDSHVLPEFVEV